MTTPVIMDAIVVVVLVAAVYCGVRRGLLRSLAGLVIVVMALVGAGIVAGTLADPAAKLVSPLIGEHIAQKVEEAVEDQAGAIGPAEAPEAFQIRDLLGLLGLDEEVRDSLAERTRDTVYETGVSVATAVVESLVRSFAYGILFILAFLAILLLLRVLAGAMGLVLKLPGLHGLNALGGGLLGLIEGVLLLFLAVWAARHLGVSFETPPLSEAHILRIFTANTPLSLLSFLQ